MQTGTIILAFYLLYVLDVYIVHQLVIVRSTTFCCDYLWRNFVCKQLRSNLLHFPAALENSWTEFYKVLVEHHDVQLISTNSVDVDWKSIKKYMQIFALQNNCIYGDGSRRSTASTHIIDLLIFFWLECNNY